MASWVTHLIIADKVLEKVPELDRRGFCVGSIAPDCNVENADWSAFTPSREVTHWMTGKEKTASDSSRFYQAYIAGRRQRLGKGEEYAFLLGYYAHLIADAEYLRFVRDEERIAAAWSRIKSHPVLGEKSTGMPETWDSLKKLIGKEDRIMDIYTMEAEYLERHPDSGYYTEILGLEDFPDYIDYLPHGAIVRKIKVMGYIPEKKTGTFPYVLLSREEYSCFVTRAVALIADRLDNCC